MFRGEALAECGPGDSAINELDGKWVELSLGFEGT
jgi:hypothetical protein